VSNLITLKQNSRKTYAKQFQLYNCVSDAPPVQKKKQEGLAVASIVRGDPSTLPGIDSFPRTRMHRDRNAQ